MQWNLSPANTDSGLVSSAYEGISKLIEQHPESVAQLLYKHGFGVPPTRLNVGRASKVKPNFFQELIKSLTKSMGGHTSASDFTGYSNLIGDNERMAVAQKLTNADKWANAFLVGSNVIRATQHPAEPYNQRVPSYYEPSGKYGVVAWNRDELQSNRWFGMDKKFVWAIGILIGIAILYELKKRG